MAKYGEGDKRWIVEERADGTNVHNWHWAERDCLEWSRARLSALLAGLTVLDGEGGLTLRTVALDKLDGEAYVNIRKGKVIPGYELSLTLSWEAEAASESGAAKVAGAAEVPYLADENADEDPFLARGKPLVLEKIREFVAAMAKGGPAKDELESKILMDENRWKGFTQSNAVGKCEGRGKWDGRGKCVNSTLIYCK